MKRSNRGITLLLALLLATAAAIGAYALTGNDSSEVTGAVAVDTPTSVPVVTVAFARVDIAAGTEITADMVEGRPIPVGQKNPHALTDLDRVVGQRAAVAIVADEQILDSRVTSAVVEPVDTFSYDVPVGKRAISIDFDEVVGAGALVQPGDFVDVIGYFELSVKDFTKGGSSVSGSDSEDQATAEATNEPDYKQYVTTYIVRNVRGPRGFPGDLARSNRG